MIFEGACSAAELGVVAGCAAEGDFSAASAAAAQFAADMDAYIGEEGLEKWRGKIMPRNSHRSPWVTSLDLRFAQELPIFRRTRGIVTFDIENFANLLNSDWGQLRQVSFPFVTPVADANRITTVGCPDGAPSCYVYRPRSGETGPVSRSTRSPRCRRSGACSSDSASSSRSSRNACRSLALRTDGCLVIAAGAPPSGAFAQDAATDPRPAPNRAEGEGPFERLIIRNATRHRRNRRAAARAGGHRDRAESHHGDRHRRRRPRATCARPAGRERATKEIDATGMYVLPGFVDLHLHSGDIPKTPDAEYVYKLWMAHGITAGRGVPFASPVFSEREKARSAKNEITAPRMFTYRLPFDEWEGSIETPEQAREWVRTAAATGIDGLKLNASPPEIMAALIDEATKLGLGTTAHLEPAGRGAR